MVTLVCFCCGHGNPIGARFCNACGASLHLKPCKACEAINGRAAAHCHRCGETFALNFASADLAPQTDFGARAEDSATPATAGGSVLADPTWHRLAAVRVAVVALGMTATVMLSGYYVHRQAEFDDNAVEGATGTASGTVAIPAIDRAETSTEASGGTPLAPAVLPASSRPSGEGAAMPAGDLAMSTRSEANAHGDVKPQASKVSRERARSQGAAPAAQSRTTRAQRPQPLPAGRSRDYAERRASPDAGQRTRQQRVAATRARPPAESSPITAGAATPVRASSMPLCTEGIVPDPNCDVRVMANGN